MYRYPNSRVKVNIVHVPLSECHVWFHAIQYNALQSHNLTYIINFWSTREGFPEISKTLISNKLVNQMLSQY